MVVQSLHRPMYDGLVTDEEKAGAMTAEVTELQKVGEDGMDFAAKTSQWIAYERDIESSLPDEDRLFYDPIAQHLYKPYGRRMSDAFAFGLKHAIFDPPSDDIGIGMEGHVQYTATRTKLINDALDKWLESANNVDATLAAGQQVLNLGCGVDTRVFWLDCLSKAKQYWEVDQAPVMNFKEKVLGELDNSGELPVLKCKRIPATMDFTKESIRDLPVKHGFDRTIPTCWILEGLIMYLPKVETEQLMKDVSNLSSNGSYIILNFSSNDPHGPSIDDIDKQLVVDGWKYVRRLMFGDDGFNFGRYPDGKPSNATLGFSIYRMG